MVVKKHTIEQTMIGIDKYNTSVRKIYLEVISKSITSITLDILRKKTEQLIQHATELSMSLDGIKNTELAEKTKELAKFTEKLKENDSIKLNRAKELFLQIIQEIPSGLSHEIDTALIQAHKALK